MKNFIVICAACVVSLLVLEIAARILTPQPLSQSWMMVDDQGLVLNRPDTQAVHHRGETSATYRINSLHMRGDMPKANVPSILVIGDSFTFGWLVNGEQTLVGHLQRQADASLGKGRVQFLNAGTGGWGTASYIDFLTRYGLGLRPDGVLVFANATDFNRAMQTGLYQVGSDQTVSRIIEEQSIGMKIKQLTTNNMVYRWLSGRSYLLNTLKQAILSLANAEDEAASAGAETLVSEMIGPAEMDVQFYNEALFAHLKSQSDDQSIPVFVSSQYHWQYTEDAYDWLVPVMAKLDVPFLANQRDIGAATNGEVEGYFIKGDPHPNSVTYKILAEKTWKWLSPKLEDMNIAR